jgi:predicted deacylase
VSPSPNPDFEIAGVSVPSGARTQVEIPVARLVTQVLLSLPVIVLHGKKAGPRLWLSAAIHGDELNGTEIIRRVLARVRPERLRGTLVAAPVVNVFGFMEQSRYLPDRRDLNRSFPGSAKGSLAARLAHLFLREVVDRCTHGLDLHTGSNRRTNLPHLRCDLDDDETRACAEAFRAPVMIHGTQPHGSLREAAGKRGKIVLVYEAGEPHRFNTRAIGIGVAGTMRLLQHLGMLPAPKERRRGGSVEVRRTYWLRAPRSGIAQLHVRLGQQVAEGDKLVVMHDTFGNVVARVKATGDGIVLGHTTTPLAHRGEAVVHIAERRGMK